MTKVDNPPLSLLLSALGFAKKYIIERAPHKPITLTSITITSITSITIITITINITIINAIDDNNDNTTIDNDDNDNDNNDDSLPGRPPDLVGCS